MKEWTLFDDARILALLNKGWTRKQIAADFGVTRNAICGRVYRLIWKPEVQPVMSESDDPKPAPRLASAAPAFRDWFEYTFVPKPNPHPVEWQVGQMVNVSYARAWSPETKWFVDWSGTGRIIDIKYRGKYIRIASDDGHDAWINDNNFCDVRLAGA